VGRPRHRWVVNIRLDYQEAEFGYMDCIGGPKIEAVGGRL
jgi:hypothetical protein